MLRQWWLVLHLLLRRLILSVLVQQAFYLLRLVEIRRLSKALYKKVALAGGWVVGTACTLHLRERLHGFLLLVLTVTRVGGLQSSVLLHLPFAQYLFLIRKIS